MSALLQAGEALAKGMPARKLIDELAALYPLMLVARTSDQRVEWASSGWAETLHDVPDLVGCTLREIIARFPRPEQSFPIVTRLREFGAVRKGSIQLRLDATRETPFEISVLPLQLSGDEPCVVVLARRAAADTAGAPTNTLIECHPDACISIDRHGFVDVANAAAAELLDSESSELVGSAAATLAFDNAGLHDLLRALACDEACEIRLALRREGLPALPVQARVAPHLGSDGERLGALLALRRAEDDTRDTDALTRRNAELEHCINSLAHDLRSPLVALLGFSRLLHQDYEAVLDDTGLHFIDRIEQAGHTMEGLIHSLLELSRIGQPGEHPALIDPRSVLVQLAAELKPRLEEGRIQLELPAAPELVFCDRTRLYQIFCNLIGNAIDHMGDCSEPRIDVTIDAEAGLHHIRVRDSGRGIAAEDHERIFEAFQSLGARRDGRRGTGMGLAIVRKIAATRGGRAWVESEPDAGATFHVTLPQH